MTDDHMTNDHNDHTQHLGKRRRGHSEADLVGKSFTVTNWDPIQGSGDRPVVIVPSTRGWREEDEGGDRKSEGSEA